MADGGWVAGADGRVVSLGSVNVDRVIDASEERIATWRDRYDWFPARGETVVVDTLSDDFDPEPDAIRHGGKGGNQGVAAAAAGADAAMLGRVGPDHAEYGALAALADAGVDADRVDVAEAPTGAAYVVVDPDGDNRIVVRPGANAAVDAAYVEGVRDAVVPADCLLLQNEVPVPPVATLLDELSHTPDGPTVILDPAPPEGAGAHATHSAVDYCTPNEAEYEALRPVLDDVGATLVRKRGADDVVVEPGPAADGQDDAAGANGADAALDGSFAVTPPSVDAVDTTGAGDVLNGYMAARLAAGAPLRAAVSTAVTAASMATRESGARRGIPSLDAVRAFEERHDA